MSDREFVRGSPDHARYGQDDEISLYDLWDVLARRLPVLLVVAALTIAGGFTYALLQPVQYEYRTGIELARVYQGPGSGGFELVVSRAASQARLEDVIIPELRREYFGGGERGPRIQIRERGGDDGLLLQSTGVPEDADRIAEFHEAVVSELGKEHQGRLERAITATTNRFASRAEVLREQLDFLEQQLEQLSEQLNAAEGVTSLVVAQQMGDIRREMSNVRVAHTDARSAVETIRDTSHSTEASFLASQADSPAGTGRPLIVALSVVLGGMLGLFAAFFAEFVGNARRYRRNETEGS